MEQYKTIVIKNVETKYEVSDLGNVRNKKTGKVLKPSKRNGYLFILINKRNYRIHRLVCSAFLANPEQKRCVNHINGIKTDNRLKNLEWNTHRENYNHALNVLNVNVVGSEFVKELNRKNISQRIRTGLNKGISNWNQGFKKYRATISLSKTKSKTLGYFVTFKEAVSAYIAAHLEKYNELPKCSYICPETNEIIFENTI